MLGLAVIWLLLIGSQGEQAAFSPVSALWLIAIPLMDMVTIMIRRIRKKQSPLKADREHLHHIFLRAGLSSSQALIVIVAVSSVLAIVGIVSDMFSVNSSLMFLSFFIVFIGYFYLISHIWKVLKKIRQI